MRSLRKLRIELRRQRLIEQDRTLLLERMALSTARERRTYNNGVGKTTTRRCRSRKSEGHFFVIDEVRWEQGQRAIWSHFRTRRGTILQKNAARSRRDSELRSIPFTEPSSPSLSLSLSLSLCFVLFLPSEWYSIASGRCRTRQRRRRRHRS